MRDQPAAELVDLLARLSLATDAQVRAARRGARRLARDLPLFESVWVDSLVQSRVLTAFQAAEINAGRGEQLLVGPYVIRRPLVRTGYADSYLAAETTSQRVVHVVVSRKLAGAEQAAAKLQAHVERFAALTIEGVARIEAAGAVGDTLWAAYAPATGHPISQWLSHDGRLPPTVALEVARQMVAALAALETAGLMHGDISATSLWLDESGAVQLIRSGVRPVVRASEAHDCEAVPSDAFEYVAPELLARGQPASIASEVFACGALWWHLLAGRSPRAGGNVNEKLRAVREAKFPDIRRIAPETSRTLADAIDRCIRQNPEDRPQSFAELATLVGAPAQVDRRRVASVLLGSGRKTLDRPLSWHLQSTLQRGATHVAAALACSLLLAAATWPLWRSGDSSARQRANSAVAQTASAGPSSTAPIHKPSAGSGSSAVPATSTTAKSAHLDQAQTARYETTADASPSVQPASATVVAPVIELAAGKEIAGATLRLVPGATVRGRDGARLRIVAPPGGVAIAADGVRFENVDFIWRQRAEAVTAPDRHAIVDVRCKHAVFAGCTFQAAPVAGFELPPAIRLSGPAEYATALTPGCHLELERCAIRGAASSVDCRLAGPVAIEIRDSLHLGGGALVRFANPRAADAPAAITLEHVTARGASSIVEVRSGNAADAVALITISAAECLFAPEEKGGIVVFQGTRPNQRILQSIEWSGQGSLAVANSAVALWRDQAGSAESLDDQMSIDGLVFSSVEFEGEPGNDPESSRAKRWLAPGRSTEPPGISGNLAKLPAIEAAGAGAH